MTRDIYQKGFTLIEAMITLSIAAILLAMAVPGFQTLSQNSNQRNAISDVNATLSRMRIEAASRHLGVTACASVDRLTCSGGAEWEAGWITFVDGAPGIAANGALDSGEEIIQVHGPLTGGATLRTLGPASVVTLSSDGLPAARATFRYCDARGLASLRALVLGAGGIVRSVTDGKDHTGADIVSCT